MRWIPREGEDNMRRKDNNLPCRKYCHKPAPAHQWEWCGWRHIYPDGAHSPCCGRYTPVTEPHSESQSRRQTHCCWVGASFCSREDNPRRTYTQPWQPSARQQTQAAKDDTPQLLPDCNDTSTMLLTQGHTTAVLDQLLHSTPHNTPIKWLMC